MSFFKLIRSLVVAGLLTVGLVSMASAQNCTIRFSGETIGSTPANSTSIAYPAFNLACNGSIQGQLEVTTGLLFNNELRLEKDNGGGNWSVVASAFNITYSAVPGTYRFTVRNITGGSSWRLKYSIPL